MRGLAAAGLLLLLLLAAPGGSASADGPVSVASSIDRDTITVGDPVLLSVTVELAAGWQVADPGVARAIGDVDVLETEPALQTRLAAGVTRIVFRYRLAAYRVGEHWIPPITVTFTGPRGESGKAETAAHLITVRSVILPEEDASDLKPLKPQLPLPGLLGSELVRLVFAAIALVAVLISVAVAALVLRRPREGAVGGLTPAGRALAELEALGALGLPEQGRSAEHYEQMTAILRRYVAEQFRLPAAERTPRELRLEMERAGIDPQQRAAIFEVLEEGEVVRFHSGRTYPAHARNALGSALAAMKRAAASEQYAAAAIRAEP